MNNVIFVNFVDDIYFNDVFKHVQQILSLDGIDSISVGWAKNNKNKQAININDLIRPEFISEVISELRPTNFDVANLLTDSQARCLIMDTVDRIFLEPRSLGYIKYYIQLLDVFWSQCINFNNVRAVVFESTPHMPWDLALFFVAKYFDVSVFIVRRTIFDNCCIITDDFRSGNARFYRNNPAIPSCNDFSNLSSDKTQILKRSNDKNKSSLASISLSGYLESLKRIIRYTINIKIKQKKIDYFLIGYCDLVRLIFLRRSNRQKSIRSYIQNCSPVDYGLEYIYFALHFRPERSTVPEGGLFSNQLDAIKLLSAIAPAGYLIYVKEHPRQLGDLTPDLRRTHQAEFRLYEEIVKLHNVRLVPLEVSSEDLIAHCRLTATITGSVAWQGLEIGKPAVVFGNTWHSLCDSSPDISVCDEQKVVLEQLLSKNKEDVLLDVARFLLKLKQRSFLGSYSYEMAAKATIGYEFLVESLGEGIASLLRKRLKLIDDVELF